MAFLVLLNHPVYGVYIVLKIRIHRNHQIRPLPALHHACHQRILMTPVSRQTNSGKMRIPSVQFFDDRPSLVTGAVIYKQNPAGRRDHPSFNQGIQLVPQLFRRLRQYLFLIIAGHYNVQNFTHRMSISKIHIYNIFKRFHDPCLTGKPNILSQYSIKFLFRTPFFQFIRSLSFTPFTFILLILLNQNII